MGCLVLRSPSITISTSCHTSTVAMVVPRASTTVVVPVMWHAMIPFSTLCTVPDLRATASQARGWTCIYRRDTMLDCVAGTITM